MYQPPSGATFVPHTGKVANDPPSAEARISALEGGLIRIEGAVSTLTGMMRDLVTEFRTVRADTINNAKPNWGLLLTGVSTLLAVVAMLGGLIWFGVSARIDTLSLRETQTTAAISKIEERHDSEQQAAAYQRGIVDERFRWVEKAVK